MKDENLNFATKAKVNSILKMYADERSTRARYDMSGGSRSRTYNSAKEVRAALSNAVTNKATLVQVSKQLYSTNPIYASVIDYLSNMFMWRYKVTPHKIYSKSKLDKALNRKNYNIAYNLMLEVVDGLSIETKFPSLLTLLFTQGSVYLTTYVDDKNFVVNTLLLPDKYCKKIADTEYGTSIISFDYSYFKDIGLNEKDLKDYLKSFPSEFTKGYNKYKKDQTLYRWQELDPRFSSGFSLNEDSIPTYIYILGGLLDYERYQDNELERSDNSLKYLVVHTMPHYEDQLIFEMDEVEALHRSLRKIVDTNDKARLITTWGDIHVENIAENDTSENRALEKSFQAIFNNAGFNSAIFTSDSVQSLEMSLIRDKGMVWRFVQEFVSFYNIAVNNYFDFKGYQADIDILPISSYTYNDDINRYKENATLGVGKIDYIIASGIKQKHIQDMFELEDFLDLSRIAPMQTSYTQTAEDRSAEEDGEEDSKAKEDKSEKNPEIEPSEEKDDKSSENPENSKPEDDE